MSNSKKRLKKLRKEKKEEKRAFLNRAISRLKGEPKELEVVSSTFERYKIIALDKPKMIAIVADTFGTHSREPLETYSKKPLFFVLNNTNRKLLRDRSVIESQIQILQDRAARIADKFIEPVTIKTRF